jgi:hypothetical protein
MHVLSAVRCPAFPSQIPSQIPSLTDPLTDPLAHRFPHTSGPHTSPHRSSRAMAASRSRADAPCRAPAAAAAAVLSLSLVDQPPGGLSMAASPLVPAPLTGTRGRLRVFCITSRPPEAVAPLPACWLPARLQLLLLMLAALQAGAAGCLTPCLLRLAVAAAAIDAAPAPTPPRGLLAAACLLPDAAMPCCAAALPSEPC